MLRALIGSVVVLVVPGALLAVALRRSMRSLATWAAVPALSLAFVFFVAEVLSVVGIAFDVVSVVIAVAILALVALARTRWSNVATVPPVAPAEATTATRTRATWVGETPDRTSDRTAQRIAFALLVIGIAVGAMVWARGLQGHALVPPEVDASNHGFFVARILHTASVDVSKVVVTDGHGTFAASSYYPLASHASAAIVVRMFNVDVGRVLLAFDILFAVILFPISMFVLARALVPREPLVAGFTALVVPALVLFPIASVGYGDIPLVMAMALVPIIVLALSTAALSPAALPLEQRATRIVLAGILLFAATTLHTSEVPLTLVLAALLVLEELHRERAWSQMRRALGQTIGIGVVVLLLLGPSIARLRGGVGERAAISLNVTQPLSRTLSHVLLLQTPQAPTRQVLLALLALAGAIVFVVRRRYAWVIGAVGMLAVIVIVSTSRGALSRTLGLPWYRSPARIDFNQAFFVTLFAGVALASLTTAVARLGARRTATTVVATIAVVVVFVVAIGYRGYDDGQRRLKDGQEQNALVRPASQAAFLFLQSHVRPDDVVVTDANVDGGLWMYTLRGVNPLFAVAPVSASGPGWADWKNRLYLLRNFDQLGSGGEVDRLVRHYHARWVYLDPHAFALSRRSLTQSLLSKSPYLRQVFVRGNVRVYEIHGLPA
jgi:hypothetical protein